MSTQKKPHDSKKWTRIIAGVIAGVMVVTVVFAAVFTGWY